MAQGGKFEWTDASGWPFGAVSLTKRSKSLDAKSKQVHNNRAVGVIRAKIRRTRSIALALLALLQRAALSYRVPSIRIESFLLQAHGGGVSMTTTGGAHEPLLRRQMLFFELRNSALFFHHSRTFNRRLRKKADITRDRRGISNFFHRVRYIKQCPRYLKVPRNAMTTMAG